ncbi:MAG TPA: O-antigen ligase family protein, partial [Actinomycetota bacterium]|nr:O-antigen ligase family protein [Actinomycetota bacterium]
LRRGRPLQLPAKGALLLIMAASVVATVSSLSLPYSLLSLLIEAYLALLFVCVANELGDDRRALRAALTVWAVAALVWAAVFIGFHYQLLPGGLQQLLVENSKGGGARVAGAAKNPNLAASYMMTSFFVLLASPWPRRRLARLVATASLLLAVYVTGSNGALLGLVVGVAVLAVAACLRGSQTPRQRLQVTGVAIVGAVALLTAALLVVGIPHAGVSDVQAVAKRERGGAFGDSLGRLDRSVGSRLTIWSNAWSGTGSRMLVGVGPAAAPRIPFADRRLGRGLHNDYLAFLIERGVLGLLGLLAFCALVLRWSGRLLAAPPQDDADGRWRLAGLAGAVVANLVLATNHESFHFRHLWLLFGLVWAASRLAPEDTAAAGDPESHPTTMPGEFAHAGR